MGIFSIERCTSFSILIKNTLGKKYRAKKSEIFVYNVERWGRIEAVPAQT
jgi:hypothetical protein